MVTPLRDVALCNKFNDGAVYSCPSAILNPPELFFVCPTDVAERK
jgi:hypothetical protein